jgi:hypothetical protein
MICRLSQQIRVPWHAGSAVKKLTELHLSIRVESLDWCVLAGGMMHCPENPAWPIAIKTSSRQ